MSTSRTSNADELAAELRRFADQGPTGEVLADCMDLSFIDAAGIGALIRVHHELGRQNRNLWLVDSSPFLLRLLDVLDLTKVLIGPARPVEDGAAASVSVSTASS